VDIGTFWLIDDCGPIGGEERGTLELICWSMNPFGVGVEAFGQLFDI
jgi:hypothetical protein